MGIAIVRPSGTEPKIKIYYSTQGYDMIEAENNMKKLVKYGKVDKLRDMHKLTYINS